MHFGRVRELVIDLTDGLTDEIATYRPDPGANSIAWLVWHLSRSPGRSRGRSWRRSSRCGRSGGRGLGCPSASGPPATAKAPTNVAAVRVSGDLLSGYHQAVHDAHPALSGRHHGRRAGSHSRYPLGSAGDGRSQAGQRDRRHHAARGSGCLRTRPGGAAGQRLASTGRRRSLVSPRGQRVVNPALGSSR